MFKKDVGPVSLETLEVASLASHRKNADRMANHTSAEMLLQSLQTLKRLRFGFENTLAKRYARWDSMVPPQPDFGQRTADFVSVLNDCMNSTDMLPTAIRLEELSLCGMDLNLLAPEVSPVDLNLGGLTSLRLESCFNLPQALPKLRSQGERLNANVGNLSSLRNFSVRVEDGDNSTLRGIKDFLMITKPLKTLYFLFEGKHLEHIAQDVLERHGSSLDSLVWETRSGPRYGIEYDESSEYWSTDCSVIQRYCVNLKALGLSFAWEDGPLQRGRPTTGPVSSSPVATVAVLIVTVDAPTISAEGTGGLKSKEYAELL